MTQAWPDPRFRELSPTLLAGIPADELGDAVLQHVHLQIQAGADEVDVVATLPKGTRAIFTTFLVDAEVNNGGFNQFFYNPHGYLAGEALAGYELLGADDYAHVMRAAIATYESERDQLAPFHDAGTLESFSKSYEHTTLGAVDDRYYMLGGRIYSAWASAVRLHPELFLPGGRG